MTVGGTPHSVLEVLKEVADLHDAAELDFRMDTLDEDPDAVPVYHTYASPTPMTPEQGSQIIRSTAEKRDLSDEDHTGANVNGVHIPVPAGCPSQEPLTSSSRHGGVDVLEAAASELRSLATVLRGEHSELGKKFETYIDALTPRVLKKIDSFQGMVNQRLEERILRRGPESTPVDEDREFKSLVKSHAEKLLYRNDGEPRTLFKLDIPTAVETLDFRKGVHPGPTVGRLRIDAASGSNSAWNLRACQIFAQDFCVMRHSVAKGKTLMDVSHEFYRLIPAFISNHAISSGFADAKSYERFQELVMKHVRRHQLTESRLQVVHEIQQLREFLPVLRRLAEEDGMSSDERDTDDDQRFHSARPFWRHPSITDWLHSIDAVGAKTLNHSFQHEGRRQESSTVDVESRVVKGLPINFYDRCYLNNLDRPQYLDLDPTPAIPLEFSSLVSWSLRGTRK